MDLDMESRVVLVTGSSQGIGQAAALAFAREGARVGVTYHANREKAEAIVETIREGGGDALAVKLDLASTESIREAVARIIERWSRLDVLVNNAVSWGDRGPREMPRFEDLSSDAWRGALRANVEGHFDAIQAVLPSMRARRWGRILNVSSGIAVDGMAGAATYGAAKAALHGLTRSLSIELGPAGILVNVVMPGLTLTEGMTARVPATFLKERAKASPIRRLLAPEEVVPMIVFLCSAANTAVTGEIIRASGGIT